MVSDIELNPGPGLSECVPVYTHCCYITPDIHHGVCCVSSKSSLGAWYLSHLLDTVFHTKRGNNEFFYIFVHISNYPIVMVQVSL